MKNLEEKLHVQDQDHKRIENELNIFKIKI
jgi:hypothetical protein